MMKIIGIIPARYASTRFPGKPLADINGKSMIQRVYEQASKSSKLSKVVVATDHEGIFDHVKSFNGDVVMTSANHPSGTDRCFEALQSQSESFDFVINIQGDEPFIQPEQIDLLAAGMDQTKEIVTLVKRITTDDELFNPNVVKVVKTEDGRALYFSRSPIPYYRHTEEKEWKNNHSYYKHIGMYGYRADILKKITALGVSPLEKAESLEQLRWLENGYSIWAIETTHDSAGIDSPDDLKAILKK